MRDQGYPASLSAEAACLCPLKEFLMACSAMLRATLLALCLLAAPAPGGSSYTAPAGDRPARIDRQGVTILPNGRLLTPLGRSTLVAPHPYGLCLSPDGRVLVASSSGMGPFALSLMTELGSPMLRLRQIPAGVKTDVRELNATFMGLAIAPDNRALYASGGDDGVILRFDLETGRRLAVIPLNGVSDGQKYVDSFAGDLTLSPDGRWLFVVDHANFRVAVLDTGAGRVIHSVPVGRDPFGIALTPDGRQAWVVNVGMFEYRPVPDARVDVSGQGSAAPGLSHRRRPTPVRRGLSFPPFGFPSRQARQGTFVEGRRVPGLGDPNVPESFSVWGLDVTDPARARVVSRIKTGYRVGGLTPQGFPAVGGSGPSAVVAGAGRVYVSNANNDTIQAFDTRTGRALFTRLLAPTPALERPRGTMPFGLALSRDGRRLYVAEAGINAVGVLDALSGRVLGHLPVGWWPSKIQVSRDGRNLYVACAKGFGSGPNGGQRFRPGPEGTYVGNLLKGAVFRIPVPADGELARHTRQVLANNGFLPRAGPPRTGSHPIPTPRMALNGAAPSRQIRSVVFIAKENRTFDEVFGDLPGVNGEAALARFGPRGVVGSYRNVEVMPNHRRLARQFAHCDNFYIDGDVSADGHRWLVGVYPNPWMAVNYVMAYGGRNNFRLNPTPGRRAIFGANSSVAPEDYLEAGSIWENLTRHRLPFRNYGEGFEFAGVEEGPGELPTGAIETVNVPMPKALFDNTSRTYPQFNTNIPDQYRADQFIRDFDARFTRPRRPMPRFVYLHLPNDHGAGPRPRDGYPFTESYMADNDYALGRIVEYLSHTPYWRHMAIFVTEDDAQSGVDHVDAHRSLCMVISPWVKRGHVSHRHASLASMHKTVELILGMRFLNQYDAVAADLADCFTPQPDLRPYRAVPVDRRLFDPRRCKDPTDPDFRRARRRPSVEMDDPVSIEREHRARLQPARH
jgi:YVTN family beta-propeller protein